MKLHLEEVIGLCESLKVVNQKLGMMYQQCFYTAFDTMKYTDEGDVFIITGDIPAMWLRDSAAQVIHYLPFLGTSKQLDKLIAGIIRRQLKCITVDPYANAFNESANGHGHQDDSTKMVPGVWERKYEVDSLCYPFYLLYQYIEGTGDLTILDHVFTDAWNQVYEIWLKELHHERSQYRFERLNCPVTDTLPNQGRGSSVAYTGMTWSGFRPSDDACTFGYLIPSNLFAIKVLSLMAMLFETHLRQPVRADECRKLGEIMTKGVVEYGIVDDYPNGPIYAYEVDGIGGRLLMDDANIPSLLSLPFLGIVDSENEIYQNTRKFILSKSNPYYYEGQWACGVGSPHTGVGMYWPMSVCVQALTSNDENEIIECIKILLRTDAETGHMHESVNVNQPEDYTRPWFAWANAMFSLVIWRNKDLIFKHKELFSE